ncbi:MAG: hypothetical protein AAGA66_02735 [Bacteroidota bacterium]
MKVIKTIRLIALCTAICSCGNKSDQKKEGQSSQPFFLKLAVLSHFEADSLNTYFLISDIAVIIEKPKASYLRNECESYDLYFSYEYDNVVDTVSMKSYPYPVADEFFGAENDVIETSFELDETKYFKSLKNIHLSTSVRGMRDLMHHIAREGKLYFRSCEDTFLIERHPEYEIRFRDPSSVNVIAM